MVSGNETRRASGATLLLFGAALALSCGGGDGDTAVAPQAPDAAPRQLTGLEIVAGRSSLRVGQTIPSLVAYGLYDNGTTGTLAATWSSSDEAVASVDPEGVVTGEGVGVAEITATFETFSASVDFEVLDPEERSTRDRPDDFDGPQIHAVYAVPNDWEDRNFDRWGDIATSFEAIQNWLAEELGYRLRLDTHGGELDVSFVRLSFTHQEGDGSYGPLNGILADIRDQVGVSPDKLYAVYYDGRSSGLCGSAPLGGEVAAVYLACSDARLGADPDEVSTFEAVMVHELFHAFGAVASCAPNYVEGSHVRDDAADLMYTASDRLSRDQSVIDVARDDYFGHGRSDCVDTARNRFWEPLPGGPVARLSLAPRVRIPAGDWPIRCGVGEEGPPEPPEPGA